MTKILAVIAACLSTLVTQAAPAPFQKFETLSAGVWQVRLFPGQRDVVFTMYGAPGDVAGLRQMVAAMRRENLGNGFDPGPAARAGSRPLFDYLATVGWPVTAYPGCADMQIQGGGCVLGRADQETLASLDQAGIFNAVQLGECGYYFHNLAPNERWWRELTV